MRLFTSKSPRVVGREALFEDALDDFLHALPRQKPWMLSRYEALLQDLARHLDGAAGRPAPLVAFKEDRAAAWRQTLAEADRPIAEDAVRDLQVFLSEWGWVPSIPAPRQPSHL